MAKRRGKQVGTGEPEKSQAEVIAEFLRLYRAARTELRQAKNAPLANGAAYQSALSYAESHGEKLRGAKVLLQARLKGAQGDYQKGLEILGPTDDIVIPELTSLWHEARGKLLLGTKQWQEAVSCLQTALGAPGYDTPGHAYNNMGIAYDELKKFTKAIECYQKALDTPGYDTPGDAYNNMGLAYHELKKFTKAIECYQKAVDTPGYDTPGYAYNNMGLAYDELKKLTKAIECYQKAVDTPGYDTPGYAYHNMGLTYYELKKFTKAIECYQKAVDTPGYDTPGDAYNNMGVAYYGLNECPKAIECCQKALDSPGYDKPHRSLCNMAVYLLSLGRVDESLEVLERVRSQPDTEGQHTWAKYIEGLAKQRRSGIAVTEGEQSLASGSVKPGESFNETPETRMVEKLRGLDDQYTEYLRRLLAEPSSGKDGLSVLRGWSSGVTLLEGSNDTVWKGGGYFLKWRDLGLAIDPGFDFLDNFHDARFHIAALNAVVVSHHHPDHNQDLGSLDDLFYEVYRRAKWNDETKDKIRPLFIGLDKDSDSAFQHEEKDHRVCVHVFGQSDWRLKHWLDLSELKLPLSVQHFPVEHSPDVSGAIGFRLSLHHEQADESEHQKPFIVGYTGDTAFFEGLPQELEDCDLLIAHISQPDAEELTDPSHEKKFHLGYNGVTKLINSLKKPPKLILIGEFWAGLTDLRIDLIQGLRQRTGKKNIFPAGLGMQIKLPTLEIRCTECGKFTEPQQIRITPPTDKFGRLGYVCENCML